MALHQTQDFGTGMSSLNQHAACVVANPVSLKLETSHDAMPSSFEEGSYLWLIDF